MFYHCSSLISLDLSNFYTYNLHNTKSMFESFIELVRLF